MNTKNKEKTPKMPLLVLLAFSSINKRKHAILLIWASILFTVYCFPWMNFFNYEVISHLFLIDDWSWIAMMAPIPYSIFGLRFRFANQDPLAFSFISPSLCLCDANYLYFEVIRGHPLFSYICFEVTGAIKTFSMNSIN